MTSVPDTNGRAFRPVAEWVVLGVAVILIIGAVFYVLSNRQQALRTSPVGLDGLSFWLASEGHSAQTFTGGWPLDEEDIGLLIVPLYDTQLGVARTLPATEDDLILQQDEVDLASGPILDKADRVTTMVVLPKWRSGMRLTGFAHPSLLVQPGRVTRSLRMLIAGRGARVIQNGGAFIGFDYTAGDGTTLGAVTYAPQTFWSPRCKPILGSIDAMILGECTLTARRAGRRVLILSDPDLINNNGLRLGDNAAIISDLVGQMAGGRQVIIDYSRRSWFAARDQRDERERSWSDLLRFFAPPFTLVWAGLVIALALILWRAALRFGPLRTSPGAGSASKMMAIAARARLMRLTNQDGALVHDYGKARLAATAAALFGPANARQYASAETFLAYARRRHPKLAHRLAQILNTLRSMPSGASAPQAMGAVRDLESLLEQITHDTRGIERPR